MCTRGRGLKYLVYLSFFIWVIYVLMDGLIGDSNLTVMVEKCQLNKRPVKVRTYAGATIEDMQLHAFSIIR